MVSKVGSYNEQILCQQSQVDSNTEMDTHQKYLDSYAAVTVGKIPAQLDTVCLSLLDSGNLLGKIAMSESFHQQLGLKLYPTLMKAKTASQENLTILGVSQSF